MILVPDFVFLQYISILRSFSALASLISVDFVNLYTMRWTFAENGVVGSSRPSSKHSRLLWGFSISHASLNLFVNSTNVQYHLPSCVLLLYILTPVDSHHGPSDRTTSSTKVIDT